MRIEETGPVVDGLFMLGHPGVPIYLLDIGRPVIIEAGMAFMGAVYARDVERVLGNRTPAALMLTHSHFDHCGAAAYLKERFAGMQVAASREARAVFARPNAIRLMGELSDAAARMAIELGLPQSDCSAFAPFDVDRVVQDGESIALDVKAYLDFVESHREGYIMIYSSGVGIDRKVAERVALMRDSVRMIIAEHIRYYVDTDAISPEDIDFLAAMVAGMTETAAMHWIRNDKITREVCERNLIRGIEKIMADLPARKR